MGKIGNLRRLFVAACATAAVLVIASATGAAPGTEANVVVFDQCANGQPPSTSTACPDGWINGILNANNSHYAEDDVVPQRVVLELPEDGPLTDRTIEISYLTRKGGVHAYDSLATWNYTQTTADPCQDLDAALCAGTATTFPIPLDPTVVADSNGPGSATSGHQLTGQVFTMYGGTITAVSSYTHDDPSGTGDSYAHVTLTYSVSSLEEDASVLLLFGGHIAASLGPRGWGVGVGAGSISGGPYHVRITAADGSSVGNRDNQIMSGAILAPANLVIRKVSVGGDDTFGYTATGGITSPFSITTSGGNGSQSFTSIEPKAYTVTESTPPTGWVFTSLVCEDEDNGTTVTGQTANIDLHPGETVTCTYTNTKHGTLIIDKVTHPSGDPQSFGFTATDLPGTADDTFSLADGTAPKSVSVAPGTYHVSENADPAGWSLTDINCVDPTTNSSDSGREATAVIAAGETVTCTFTNAKHGTLIIDKVTNPAGDSQSFGFTATDLPGTADDTFNLADGTAPKSVSVAPGTYHVSENADPTGWSLTDINCVDPTTNSSDSGREATAVVAAGETVTCTFTNTKTGTLIIDKVTNPAGDSQLFGFTASDLPGTADDTFSLADGTTPKSVSVLPGTYHVSENADPTGWSLTDITCVDPTTNSSDVGREATAVIAAGETVTCTFTNTKHGTLIVDKVTNPAGDSQLFGFTASDLPGTADDTFSLADGTTPKSVSVVPGTYHVSEDADPTGWNLTDITCVDPTTNSSDSGRQATAVIAAGETVTCTFTNTKQATIVVEKITVGGSGSFAFDGPGAFNPTLSGGQTASLEVAPGQYAVSETVPAGWDLTNVDCDDDASQTASTDNVPPTKAPGQTGTATYNVGAGEIVKCTFTNTKHATIVVEKVTVGGGGTFAFDGPGDFNPSLGNGGSASQQLPPGQYTVSETVPAGWDLTNVDCDDDNSQTASTDDVPPTKLPGQTGTATYNVEAGETVKCTFTNSKHPRLIVIKTVINDNGGTAVPGDFAIQVTGHGPNPGSFNGQASPGTSVAIGTGPYNVTETEHPDYTASYSAECSGELDPGETATCTITNNDKAPKLTLVKVVVNDNGGTAQASAWALTASGPTGFTGPGPSVASGGSFDQGTYNLSEAGPSGYAASDWNCVGEGEGQQVDADTVNVGLGDDVTCTITNNDQPATLIVIKSVINDNGGTATASSFQMTINGVTAQGGNSFPGEAAPGTTRTLTTVGAYNVTETLAAGYTQTGASADCQGTIALGQTKTCTITNNDVPPTITGQGAIDVQKSANPTSVKEPGGPVEFTVTIRNTSTVNVVIESVVDSVFGDLDDTDGGAGIFDTPINLAPGESVSRTFTRQVNGVGGQVHTNVVTASGRDQFSNPVSDSDDARVEITPRLIDLVIVKTANPTTVALNATFSYTMTVTNKGPDTATNVQLADPAPSGITYLSANPSKGTCNTTASLITCSLGNLAANESVTISVSARATATGTHTNVATVTGGGGRETNPADNTDDAVVNVPAPLRPPTAPKPPAQVCLTLTVSPKMIKADGKPDRVSVKVTAGKKRVKGTKISIFGAGVRKTGRSNANGMAFIKINPRRAGLITITAVETNQRVCGPKRIGVVGVFLPPLTG